MKVSEAKQFVGQHCAVTWLDRKGCEQVTYIHIEDLSYSPFYGNCLIGDTTDLCLDKVVGIALLEASVTETRH